MNANLSSNIFYGDSSYALQLEGLKDKKSNQSKKNIYNHWNFNRYSYYYNFGFIDSIPL